LRTKFFRVADFLIAAEKYLRRRPSAYPTHLAQDTGMTWNEAALALFGLEMMGLAKSRHGRYRWVSKNLAGEGK
jgi:hypothetical protein